MNKVGYFNMYDLKTRKRIEKHVTASYLLEEYGINNPWRYANKGIPCKGKYFLLKEE